jgi:hypothetical protein
LELFFKKATASLFFFYASARMDYVQNMLMNLPFTLPPWMPGWVFLLLLLPALLWVLAFLLMPFSVFGVKGRIEALEAQVDAMHEEMRMAAMRAAGVLPPAPKFQEPYEETPSFARMKRSQRGTVPEPAPEPPPRPLAKPYPEPVPMPPPMAASRERLPPAPQNPPPRPARRTEPRLD